LFQAFRRKQIRRQSVHLTVKQVLIKGGSAVVEEVPAPTVSPKNVLVALAHSCVSVGTEMTGLKMSGMPLYRRALKQPENVKRVLEMMRDQGVRRTLDRVRGKLSAGSATGYSAAGQVLAVGSEVVGFAAGDLVACAGAGIANHAEVIDVPVNLAVKIPKGLSTEDASTVTLGAIAMQGLRRTAPTLGETIAVVGLGILGQLMVQLLKANGCRVIGTDLDAHRVQMALANGMDYGIDARNERFVERVLKLTDDFGADATVITAATASDEVVSQAAQATRKKGRVVLVGDVGLGLKRSDFYAKELDFLISTSYGPGRYDPVYEEGGHDYPLPYVRWTENRNMEAYLRMLADGRLTLERFTRESYPVDQAGEAYARLNEEGEKPLLVFLAYPEREGRDKRLVSLKPACRAGKGMIRVALAGASSFAQGVHLPNMFKLRDRFRLRSVMSRTGANAKAVASQYKAEYITTDYEEILADSDIDLVLIATRHNLHGPMVLQALEAGKHVFVEKPLAVNEQELAKISEFYCRHPDGPVLMTGFNRRFSPAICRAAEILSSRTTPIVANYRMNAGYISLSHWVHTEEGAGRNIGEACHIYDLFNYFTNAEAVEIHAASIAPSSRQWARNDNFVATVSYQDGSVCSLTYTALGDKSHAKERMDIYADGKVISLDDYTNLVCAGGNHKGWSASSTQKGHMEELKALADCLHDEGKWPISLEHQLQATAISFEVERQIQSRGEK